MHQVELRFQTEIAPDRPGRGLLDRISAPRELPERRNCLGSLYNRCHHKSRSDELQQRSEEWFAFVFGIVLAGQLLANFLEFQRRDGEAFALHAVDDLTDQPSFDSIRLDQYQGPFGHGVQQ